jgi:hypothetical protein
MKNSNKKGWPFKSGSFSPKLKPWLAMKKFNFDIGYSAVGLHY